MKNAQDILTNHEWRITNDVVMGGMSDSSVTRTENGTWLFSGEVSLENSGGFVAVQAVQDSELDLSDYMGLQLRVCGTAGTGYWFTVRCANMEKGSYRGYFEGTGHWEVMKFSFVEMKAITRGKPMQDAPPLDLARVQMVGFIVSNKQAGKFSLEIESIQAF
jgi:hypothetical protein